MFKVVKYVLIPKRQKLSLATIIRILPATNSDVAWFYQHFSNKKGILTDKNGNVQRWTEEPWIQINCKGGGLTWYEDFKMQIQV